MDIPIRRSIKIGRPISEYEGIAHLHRIVRFATIIHVTFWAKDIQKIGGEMDHEGYSGNSSLKLPMEFRVDVDGEIFKVKVLPFSDGDGATAADIQSEKIAPPQPVRIEKVIPTGAVPANMAGLVLSLEVELGDKISAGDLVATIEMMKMKRRVNCPHDGIVQEILVDEGDVVEPQDILMVVF
jgi:acetyl/propionyl-CoA carboxylase alpha subunit